MAAPSFVAASTGATDAGGAWAATGAAGTSGNVVIVQILQDGTTNGAVSFTGASHIENLAGTDNAWTSIAGGNADGSFPIGSAATGRQFLKIGRLIDASAPTISGGNSTSEDLYWRFYEFSNVNVGTLITDVIENSTAGNATNGAATSATCSDTAVTTLGPDRLALNFVGLSDDAMGLGEFIGETGGDWKLPVAIYEESSGTDATIALQVGRTAALAYRPGGSTIFLGNSSTGIMKAQSFVTTAATDSLFGLGLSLAKVGAPADNLIIELQSDSGGAPSGTVLTTVATIAGGSLSTSFTHLSWETAYSLTPSTTYWIVLSRSGAVDVSNYYSIDINNPGVYADGTGASYIGGWANQTWDIGFDVGGTGTINGGSDSITSIGWGVVGFALIGTTPSGPAVRAPRNPAINFQDPAFV